MWLSHGIELCRYIAPDKLFPVPIMKGHFAAGAGADSAYRLRHWKDLRALHNVGEKPGRLTVPHETGGA
jgi:hypothetical protein